jgi:SAM-dependent methyltransferase
MAALDPTDRFQDRVADYVRTRPGYPPGLLAYLRERGVCKPAHRVADVGSGTGILTRLFLEAGHAVVGVEPNGAMRDEAERTLGHFDAFRSVDGRAESTGLEDGCVDFVVAGQAFHWFDPAGAKAELGRIVVAGGEAALVWNNRRLVGSEFLVAYEALLVAHGIDYGKVGASYAEAQGLRTFFGGGGFTRASFPNVQIFDREGLRGRLLSSSYAPNRGQRGCAPMLAELDRIFEQTERGGQVRMEYDTLVFHGPIGRGRP